LNPIPCFRAIEEGKNYRYFLRKELSDLTRRQDYYVNSSFGPREFYYALSFKLWRFYYHCSPLPCVGKTHWVRRIRRVQKLRLPPKRWLMAHYLPWFASKEWSGQWGWH
jgi:hypothetical protein